MKISIMTWIYNRAHLLKYSLQAVARQLGPEVSVDLNVADDRSTDSLDEVLQSVSYLYGWDVYKYDTSEFKAYFNNERNCPSAYYNALVAVCQGDYVIKIDPEFIFLTDSFVDRALVRLTAGTPSIIMPLPHHVREFEYNSLAEIRDRWREHEYSTHINANTASRCNVYYGCIFNRQAYIDLGGIDLQFHRGIGSEDDHFLDQWRRKYGDDNVVTLLEEEGLHMWHGGFSAGVPQELYHLVNMNADLRAVLAFRYPNGGDFDSVTYPTLSYTQWKDGNLVVEKGNKAVRQQKGEVNNGGFVIGYSHRE